MNIATIATKPSTDRKAGTSGLHRAVTVFRQTHYPENFVQAVIECLEEHPVSARLLTRKAIFAILSSVKKQVLFFLIANIPPFQLGQSP